MRIIGGHLGGRRFTPPAKNWPTRPTTDQTRESLFNILSNRIDFDSVSVLDLFAGSGSHSYEFVSRGCADVTSVDKFPACVTFISRTAVELGIADKIKIVKADVFRFIKAAGRRYDYIFADPPFDLPALKTIPDLIFESAILAEGGLFVLEHDARNDFSSHIRLTEDRKYGTTIFSFFR